MVIRFILNHDLTEVEVEPLERLIDMLRNRFGLTGAKEGCGEGECGACTVILDGDAVAACMIPAIQANGTEILTIEGLNHGGAMDRLQEAFINNGAIQCGYCTPGMLMSVKALLMKNPEPDAETIKRAIEGNLCRCTGYHPIIKAVESLKGERS